MSGRVNLQLELAALPRSLPTPRSIDYELVGRLADRVPEGHRLAFARSFTGRVVAACWDALDMPVPLAPVPDAVASIALSQSVTRHAEDLAAELASCAPALLPHLLGAIYTTALPDSYRASHGIFYTPAALVDRLLTMAEQAGIDWRTARVLDPACGGGAFLVPLASRMVEALSGTEPKFILQQLGARLLGIDIDPFAGWLAQSMLEVSLRDLIRMARKSAPRLVEAGDSLEAGQAGRAAYDLVIGNPPYGRTALSPERRRYFARSLHGHANLYGLFTDAALHWVKKGGVIGYVTPTSMLSGLYFKSLRVLLAAEAPPLAIDFVNQRDGVFRDVLQETMLATYRRGALPRGGTVGIITLGPKGAAHRKVGKISLPAEPQRPWLLPRSADQAGLVRRLASMPHRLSHYGYGVSTGPLVWNRFKPQLLREKVPGAYPVVWAESVTSDGRFVWRSEKRNHAPWFLAKRPKDDWLIVNSGCVLLQRTTAKEQSRRLIAAELPAQFVRRHRGITVENHLNMIRAVIPVPTVSTGVIAALMNSAAADEAFRCINGSVAVSAFELEELPLPSPRVLERVERLLASNASRAKIEAVISAAYKREDAAGAP